MQDFQTSVHRLTPGDVGAFREMLSLFGAAFGERETYSAKQPSDTYLESLLEDECFFAIVARKAKTILGGLAAYELKKFEQERKEIYIYDLAVAENARRRGIATEMIERLRGIAKDRGAYVIFVQADRGDTPALNLYGKLGEREEVYQFDIPV